MTDLRQLRYFLTLSETLNYGRAAERLNITQPPLSRQIAGLEKMLGVKLFNRHHHGVSLTAAGQAFQQEAKTVMAAYGQACRNARLAGCGEKGSLSVGFMMHAAYSTLPDLTRRMVTAFPDVKLLLHEVTPGTLVKDVLDGIYDTGVVFHPGSVHGLEYLTLRHERLCLAVNSQHPLARKRVIGAADFQDEPLIVTPHAAAPVLRDMIDLFLRHQGIEPYYRLETQLQQTIVSLVAEGLGMALVPESVKKLSYAGVKYKEVAMSPGIEQVLIWRKGNTNPALALFVKLARHIFENEIPAEKK